MFDHVFMADAPVQLVNTHSSAERDGDQELLEWLNLHGADADSIQRVI